MEGSEGLDIPMIRLRPLRERKVSKREFNRILASIKAVGLIEPLVVYPEGDGYVILDGVQRYRALLELGVEVAPCILGPQREAFTCDRMVNRVSPVQEHRMIEKSLEEVDEASIAAALGITTIGHRLKKALLKRLHPDVAAAFDEGKINRVCAREFTHVRPARQKEILDAMAGYKDYSTAFVRTLVVKTPPHQRDTRRRKNNPWDRSAQRRNDLLKQLADAEQKHDFYSRLYKQYTIDLLRMAIYVWTLITNTRVREYLQARHPAVVAQFEAIIADARG
ncbi:ParB N-terminal domain-containing protein [bacterium]|nr:ParB N-terminal domain-containing protein [bacterium]